MNGMKHSLASVAVMTVVCLAAIFLSVLLDNVRISTSSYAVSMEKLWTPIRLVLLSDLHGRTFGRDNSRLIARVGSQSPDVILLAGDMLDRSADEEEVQKLLQLLEGLCEIAPVYFAPGNHELEYMKADDTLLDRVARTGATVVNDSYVDIAVNGQPLRIGGTMGYGFYFGRSEEEFTSSPEYRFLKDFENTGVPKICLAHMPDTFIFNGAYDMWDVELVLSGHTHGGLIRLPFIGGLYAPMQGWFPEYDRGCFRLGEHMQMIITSGLAGHGPIPRINNRPEIAVVELTPQN